MGIEEELRAIFFEEAREHVSSLEADLIQLEEDSTNKQAVDDELVNRIFRSAHTIKGGAGSVGFNEISGFTHTVENVLDKVREHAVEVTQELISVMLKSVDCISRMIDAEMHVGEAPSEPEVNELVVHLSEFLGETVSTATNVADAAAAAADADGSIRTFAIKLKFAPDVMESGTDPSMIIEELGDLGEVHINKVNTRTVPGLDKINPYRLYMSWEVELSGECTKADLDGVFIFISEDNPIEYKELASIMVPDNENILAGTAPLEADVPEPVETDAPEPVETDAPEPVETDAPEPVEASTPDPVEDLLAPVEDTKPSVTENETNQEGGEMQTAMDSPVEEEMEGGKAGTQTAHAKRMSSVRVDTERLDRMVNLVGELVIGQARVAQLTTGDDASPEVITAVESLDRITRDLQDEAMSMRMLPIGPTFVQFQRVVRDLAVKQNKEVSLDVSGQETELDKSIIEKIGDPLKHMVRNAVDHGLEGAEERMAAGKPAKGNLKLSAFHAEGSIVIEISDDGRGLDAEAIAEKAVREGLIPADHNLSNEQIYQLIFHPGLSTAKKVTDVSGRGVGMDVVKRNIEELRGRIDITSVKGKGSTFRITLPLTLAIIEGMALAVGEETFLIPLLSIVESIRPQRSEVQTIEERGEVVMVRGDALPLVRLHDTLNVFTERKHPAEALVIIVEVNAERYCLLVDDILGQQQVVIKTMEQNYKKMDGIAGASILADGRVAMILDVGAVVRTAFKDKVAA